MPGNLKEIFARFGLFVVVIALTLGAVFAALSGSVWGWTLIVLAPLAALGIWNLLQPRHSLMRNYPILAHGRWIFEELRPFLRQYIVEGNLTGRPFNRHQRSIVYERAKNVVDSQPFGSDLDFYDDDYEMTTHSMAAKSLDGTQFRTTIGNAQCKRPYEASLLNVSAMSFGSLSANAIRALNKGAEMGGFYHDTGEGGLSEHHRAFNGDLVWELGTGYFGCRDSKGRFDPDLFRDTAQSDQVKMIEIKLSQGAKPGHGGVLPGAKVTPEIAKARQIQVGQECVSPPAHPEFDSPVGLMEFVARLRELSDGKPVGLKLCVGHPWELLALCKASLKTGIRPDFIVVDGAEGGTGAAPEEFSDNMGLPLRDGLIMVRNALVGSGLRDEIAIGASGKVFSAFSMANNLALGADWCNAARAFMFSLGCVMTKRCHTDTCPTGVATQNPSRQRGLVVEDKAERVYHFQRNTLKRLGELVGAAGLDHPSELRPHHLYHRRGPNAIQTMDRIHDFLDPNILIDDPDATPYAEWWAAASPDSFKALRETGPGHHRIIARG